MKIKHIILLFFISLLIDLLLFYLLGLPLFSCVLADSGDIPPGGCNWIKRLWTALREIILYTGQTAPREYYLRSGPISWDNTCPTDWTYYSANASDSLEHTYQDIDNFTPIVVVFDPFFMP